MRRTLTLAFELSMAVEVGASHATLQGEPSGGGFGTSTGLRWPKRGGAMGGSGHGDRGGHVM
jgi:hypothetical protein